MKIVLPDPVKLDCPGCGFQMRTASANIAGRTELTCPSCAKVQPLYFWLPAPARQELYSKLRSRVLYLANQSNSAKATN